MKKSRLIAIGLILFAVVGAFFIFHQPRLEFFGIPPVDSDAFCTDKIERVRVVHLIPGRLQQKVTLGNVDPEFAERANDLLSRFWDGEITYVVANNYSAMWPINSREISLILFQQVDKTWVVKVLTYSASALDPYAGTEGSALKERESAEKKIDYDGPTSGIMEIPVSAKESGNSMYNELEPKLLYRSLQDLVAGRCDRLMSGVVSGGAKTNSIVPVGEFDE